MWEVLDRYFSVNGLVKQQLDSFNRFTEQISLVISEYGKFQISIKDQYDVDEKKRNSEELYEFKFEDKILRSAVNHKNNDKNEEVDAMTCRLRDLNYECYVRARLMYRKI